MSLSAQEISIAVFSALVLVVFFVRVFVVWGDLPMTFIALAIILFALANTNNYSENTAASVDSAAVSQDLMIVGNTFGALSLLFLILFPADRLVHNWRSRRRGKNDLLEYYKHYERLANDKAYFEKHSIDAETRAMNEKLAAAYHEAHSFVKPMFERHITERGLQRGQKASRWFKEIMVSATHDMLSGFDSRAFNAPREDPTQDAFEYYMKNLDAYR